MYRNCQSRPIIADQIARTCDELNNVLTAIMLRAGLIADGSTAQEIEQLSMRAKTAVQNLRVIADGLHEHDPGQRIPIGVRVMPDRK